MSAFCSCLTIFHMVRIVRVMWSENPSALSVETGGAIMNKHRADKQSQQQLVTKWLKDFGLEVTQGTTSNAIWLLFATEQIDSDGDEQNEIQPWRCAVAKPAGFEDRIIIQTAYSIEPHLRRKIEEMPSRDRVGLLWDIRMNMLHLPAETEGLSEPLEVVNFHALIFNEAVTKTALYNAIVGVKKTHTWLGWRLMQEFGGQPSARDSRSFIN